MNQKIPNITKLNLETKHYKELLSLEQIAKYYGVGISTIRRRFDEYGLKSVNRKSPEARAKYSAAKIKAGNWMGNKNPNWKGGISSVKNERSTGQLQRWRNAIRLRDNMICQQCGLDGKNICPCCKSKPRMHTDHIKPWVDYPTLRYELSNGQILCEVCHFKKKG